MAFLQELSEQYHLTFEEDIDLPLWYIINCGVNSQYNALELANIFYETKLFAISEPEFMGALQMDCVNDSMFDEQWNLMNIGQFGSAYSGIDINYCNAHAITQGNSSVVVGVYDMGVDLTHPDINIHSFSYDAYTESSPSQIYSISGIDYHGTACAGIIGAKTNNSLGAAGIAPNCPIMSLSINFAYTTSEQLKKGYVTAANNGCYVISNSWHWGVSSSFIDEGISYALSQGRNGKGCVIVFSAGNENKNGANYPANSNDSIIVVGAISPCGERKNPASCDGERWGSNYGDKIDVVAPGVKIRTTDNVGTLGRTFTDYMSDFNGTSSACPHVAAVAALVLSVNPDLTQKQVADILESTSQKIGSYTYSNTFGRPNGIWNNEMGYGLVDAYSAVLAAKNEYIQNKTYASGTSIIEYYPEIFAGYSVTDAVPYGNVVVKSGSNVTFKATDAIHLRSGFRVEKGANFRAYIEPVSQPSSPAPSMIRDNGDEERIPTGINSIETAANNSFSIFPNPATDYVTLSSTEPISQTMLYNLNGQLVLQTGETEIDVSALSAGVYIVHAQTANGQLLTAKFVHM